MFTHFPPVDTYTAELTGRELAHAARNFRDKGAATRSLVPFGHGDGGGGPTREMLGRARRTASLAGSPTVAVETPAAFFEAAEAEYPDAPVWAGELYLEIHRGTYTSQAAMKQGNRRSEHLLREAELWSRDGRCAGAAGLPGRRAGGAVADGAAAPVPRHPPRLVDRVGAPRGARDVRRGRGRLEGLIDRALDALAGDGDDAIVFNAGPVARERSGCAVGGFAPASGPQPPRRRSRCEERQRRASRPLSRTSTSGRLDDGGVIRSSARQGARPRGAAARGRGDPAPAAPRPPGEVGRVGPRQLLPRGGHPPAPAT